MLLINRVNMEKYYIVEFKGADPQGPFELTEIQTRIGYGEITPVYLYREENGYEWKPIYELPDVEDLFDEEMLAIVKKPLPPIPPKKPIPAGLPPIPDKPARTGMRVAAPAAAWAGATVSSGGMLPKPGAGSGGMIAGGIVYFIAVYIALALSIEEAESSSVFAMMLSACMVAGGAMLIKMLLTFVPGSTEKDKGNYLYGIIIALPIIMVIWAMLDTGDTQGASSIAERFTRDAGATLMYAFVVVVTLLVSAVMRIRRDASGSSETGFGTPLFFVLISVVMGVALLFLMSIGANVGIHCGCLLIWVALLLFAYKLGDSGFSSATLAWAMCSFFVLPLWCGWLLPELFEDVKLESMKGIAYISSWAVLPFSVTALLLGARLASDDKKHQVTLSVPSIGWMPLVAVAVMLTVPEWITLDSRHDVELGNGLMAFSEIISMSLGLTVLVIISAMIWGAVWGTASFVYTLLSRNKWSVMLNGLIACTVGACAHYLLSGIAAVSSLNTTRMAGSWLNTPDSGKISSYGRIFDDAFFEPWFYSNINMLVVFVIMFLVIANREESR